MIRRRLRISGLVQGVGFRPFVYRLARRFSLNGRVCNNAAGVEVEAEGSRTALTAFAQALEVEAPPAAVIEQVESWELPAVGATGFVIDSTDSGGAPAAGVVPDLAVCPDCLREMLDPVDRRHLYPFINCTNCGPRYTIIEKIPYDRPHTTMGKFTMCPACRAEYDDPASRRFHAQPNACPACGPQVVLVAAGTTAHQGQQPVDLTAEPTGVSPGEESESFDDSAPGAVAADAAVGPEAITGARHLLRAGGILAVKGIGGFHLAVNAADDWAVARLRRRKGREAKPLAVMVRDAAAARGLVHLDPEEEKLLTSPARPIVLAVRLSAPSLSVAPAVAPDNRRLGLMLAYAPLHYLLLDDELPVLVMTSANRSSEPICIANDEARRRLVGIADALLLHDREIARGNDDSVVAKNEKFPVFLRRGRGYAPGLLPLATEGVELLAVGAELKNTVCLAARGRAVISQHLGDLQNLEGYRMFCRTIDDLSGLFAIRPQMVAHDLHPDYLASRWARQWAADRGLPAVAVQHHHAHLAACLAENHHRGPALGLILDGTGYGPDHTIWGGEILLGEAAGFSRYGHLEPMPLPGGDLAVKQPWRTGLAYLHRAFGGDIPPCFGKLPLPADIDRTVAAGGRKAVIEMLNGNINCPVTTSCGRLFDAVAVIAGGRREISYEAQAAIELMQAGGGLAPPSFAWELTHADGRLIMAVSPMIRDIATAVAAGAGPAEISRRFHYSLVKMFTAALNEAAAETGVKTVALSGGVMQNEVLLAGLTESLERTGLTVLLPQRLPPNDGGIAFGQAVVASNRSAAPQIRSISQA